MTKLHTIKCHRCSTSTSLEGDSEMKVLSSSEWGFVFNTEKGLNITTFCPECFSLAQKKAEELQAIINLDFWDFDSLLKKDK